MTRANPQLLIIAGPNGAGKSTYSKDMSPEGAFVFDADKERAVFEKQFPDLPDESIAYAIEQVFFDRVDLSLKKKAHLTIETNFRDHKLMDTVERFQTNGFSTSLVYLGLASIEQSLDRVQHRVRQGGHFVDNYSIRYNYEEGLRNMTYFADRFDAVRVIDASGDYLNLKTLYQAASREVLYLADELPEWAVDSVNTVANKLRPGFNREQGDEENRRRGPRR